MSEDLNKENEPKNEEEEHKKKKKKKKKKHHEDAEEKNDDKDNNQNKDTNNNEQKEEDRELNEEALANIPSKEVPKKKKKKKKKEEENPDKEKEKDKDKENDIEKEKEKEDDKKGKKEKKKKKDKKEKKESTEDKEDKEKKEIDINDILNKNSDNNGGLMLTELLDIEEGKSKKKKHHKKDKDKGDKSSEKILEEKEIKNNIDFENELTEDKMPETKSDYLKDKFDSLQLSDALKTGINKSIIKSHEDIHDDIKNDKLKINSKIMSNSELMALNKSLENLLSENGNVFLTGVDKYFSKENIKYLKNLKTEEQILRKNIAKLNQNQKMIENSVPLKDNLVENNIRNSQLKTISKTKDELMLRLEKINQKIEILLYEEKLRQKSIQQFLPEEEDESKFNTQLAKMQKEENKIRLKFQKDIEKTIEKKNKELDEKEKNLSNMRQKLFNEARKKEKELFLRRKNEIDEKLEKTKKFINEKVKKTEKDYLFFRFKENFEQKEKRLLDKINMTKKMPLVTQEELKELADKIEMQKQYLIDNAEEKKKQMQQLWKYRSQTLPNYRHPLQVKIEEEKMKKISEEEDEQKRKEYNQLEKINYKPPSVKINKRLKTIREKRINQSNKDMVLETELNNKKRLNKFRISPINTIRNKSIKDEHNSILNNNNYIDLTEVKKALINKNKNRARLKPIQILHPRPEKPIDYLKELKEKRNMSTELEKKKVDNFDDLFTGDKGNENILESLEMAKIRTDSIDKQVERKKEMMNASGGYLKNPYMASEIGDLLVESIQAKLKIMNKLNGE